MTVGCHTYGIASMALLRTVISSTVSAESSPKSEGKDRHAGYEAAEEWGSSPIYGE